MSNNLTPEEKEIEHGWVNPWWTHVRVRTKNNDLGYWQHDRRDVFIINDRIYIKDRDTDTCYYASLKRCKFVQIIEWSDDWKLKELP